MKRVVTFVLNRESKGNGSQHGGKDVCTCSWCGDILMTVLLPTNANLGRIMRIMETNISLLELLFVLNNQIIDINI